MMQFDDIYWIAWLLLVFLPYELYAAFTKEKGDTFSENVWSWFAIGNPNAKYGRLRRFSLMGMLITLSFHFVYQTSVVWFILFSIGGAASVVYHYTREKE